MCCLFLSFMISLDIVGATRWSQPLLRGAKIALNTSDAIAKESLSEAKKAYRPFVAKYALSNCTQCKSRKDYSSPCPEKWSIQEDSCQADKTYGGPCSSTQTFIGDSISERRQVEIMCKVCWPCDATCIDVLWNLPCPYGYSPAPIPYYEYASATKQSCISDFQSECESMVTFSDMSEKQQFSERCEAQWPCQESCASTSAVCPQRWIHIGDNLCVAPSNYKPSNLTSCPLVNDFSLWSIESKNSVAKLCQYTWSCALPSALQDGAVTLQHAGKLDVRPSVSNWQLDSASGPITGNGDIMGR